MKKILKGILYLVILIVVSVILLEIFSSYTPSKIINQQAPVKTRQTISINAPVEKAWNIMSNIDNWKTWQPDISSAKINGAFESGNSFDWKTGGLTIHSTLHSAEPYKSIGWSGKAFGSFAIHNWLFTEKNGTTTVIVEESMEGWLVNLMKGTFQSHLEPATKSWLVYLKTQAEKN